MGGRWVGTDAGREVGRRGCVDEGGVQDGREAQREGPCEHDAASRGRRGS